MIYPLDLQTILVNTLVGNTLLFGIVAFIVIAMLAAYFKMPNTITLVMIVIFALMFPTETDGLWLFVILMVAFAFSVYIKSIVTK